MGTPSNPGWPFGFVPTSAQWAAAFSSKVDYPAPIDQGGTGAQTAAGANYNTQQRQLVATPTVAAQPLTVYSARTGLSAITFSLPPLGGVSPGDWISIADVDFNANTNNITITANGSDVIALYGTTAGSQVLNVAGVQARLVANATYWRLLV